MKSYYKTKYGAAYHTECETALSKLRSKSIDLIVTSPPFALTREKEYGNLKGKDYLEWFESISLDMYRVLKNTGSLVVELGGTYEKGAPVRSVYQFDVLYLLRDLGFHLAQDFYLYNPAKFPAPIEYVTKNRIRVKDSVSNVWWLVKNPKKAKSNNRNVLAEYSESMKRLLKNTKSQTTDTRPSGWSINPSKMVDNGGAIPSNLLVISNTDSGSTYFKRCKEYGIKAHPARYAPDFPKFFIKFLTDENDMVLDPFAGSNTTGYVAESLHRRWLAFERVQSYIDGSKLRFFHKL